ncbi:hypothetical protein F5Y15DRAFT_323628 [Xylariaceae sp. FL0016]|nr:hypothetical protein F5Y15DRAFT_323628 [Xylariaceae sp. FL0016]
MQRQGFINSTLISWWPWANRLGQGHAYTYLYCPRSRGARKRHAAGRIEPCRYLESNRTTCWRMIYVFVVGEPYFTICYLPPLPDSSFSKVASNSNMPVINREIIERDLPLLVTREIAKMSVITKRAVDHRALEAFAVSKYTYCRWVLRRVVFCLLTTFAIYSYYLYLWSRRLDVLDDEAEVVVI